MNARKRDNLIPPHLNETQMVAYLDGELPRAGMEAARAHLESCWSCRSLMGVVQNRIDNFLRARDARLPQGEAFSESRVEQFRNRLSLHAHASPQVGLTVRERMAGWVRQLGVQGRTALEHRKAVLATAMAACVLVVMFTDVLNTRVSADSILAQAESFEAAHSPSQGRVRRTTMRLERISGANHQRTSLGSVVVVRDSVTPLMYISAQAASGSETWTVSDRSQVTGALLRLVLADATVSPALVQYLTEQHWIPDVSTAEFRRLVGARGSSDTVVQHEAGVYRLQYPFASGHPSGIAEAMLTVNEEDYSPNSLSIVTSAASGGQEYRIVRTESASEARTVEVAKMFAPTSIGRTTTPGTSSAPQFVRATPLTYANSRASETEVTIAEALHKVDACLGEEVNLFPMSDGSVLVQGLVDNSSRRDAIRHALRAVDATVKVEIFVPRELKSGSELFNPPDQMADSLPAPGASPTATLAELSNAKIPLYRQLYQHLSTPGATEEDNDRHVALFSNEVVTLARQAFLHAWALKRLDREFAASRIAGLPEEAQRKIEQMRQDHRRWVSTIAHRQSEMLNGIAEGSTSEDMAVESDPQDSQSLLRLAQEQNDLVRSLFTTSQQKPEAAGSLTRLLSVLRHMGS